MLSLFMPPRLGWPCMLIYITHVCVKINCCWQTAVFVCRISAMLLLISRVGPGIYCEHETIFGTAADLWSLTKEALGINRIFKQNGVRYCILVISLFIEFGYANIELRLVESVYLVPILNVFELNTTFEIEALELQISDH